MRYRYGFPFITAAVLAVVTIAWHQFYGGIWDFALMALISTVFTLLCGGRFRTFFAVIALTPPFLFDIGWLLLRSPVGFPHSIIRKVVGMSFFWFVGFRFFSSGSLRRYLIVMNETLAVCPIGLFAASVLGSLPECVSAKSR